MSHKDEKPDARSGEIVVPPWVVIATIVICWFAGGAILAAELLTDKRFEVMLLACWIISLPVAGTNFLQALAGAIKGMFTAGGPK